MTLLLTRADVEPLFTPQDYVRAVAGAFAAHARGEALEPALLHVDGVGGEFHVKAGGLRVAERTYFGLKANGGFFRNPKEHGLPAIQGVIYLADAATGAPLAVMDSIHITIQRTAAATAVAARHLARADAEAVTICGAGRQAHAQIMALAAERPIQTVYVWSRSPDRARECAREMRESLGGATVIPVPGIAGCAVRSQIIVTCTPARAPFLERDHIPPGAFVAAVGADSPDKQELDPLILREADKVVTDLTAQCARVGELHHAIAAGLVTENSVHAELGAIVAGLRPGRQGDDEVIVFDSTGTALQDVACAAAIYETALARGIGRTISFAPPAGP